ncbi:MAG TPA: hypothetical protein VFX76_12645, partial [Roseiflexaceae bacterium]|nr:hypothetical protein [Roseiflexaceae bacterium]
MNTLDASNVSSLDPIALAQLQRRMHGELLTPDLDTYELAWRMHSQRFAGRPALIARCLTTHDVVLAIVFARERKLTIAASARDPSEGAMLFDLSQMRQISIDPLQQIARVQSGATAEEFTQAATTYGLAGDTVLALEIVALDGTIVTARAH